MAAPLKRKWAIAAADTLPSQLRSNVAFPEAATLGKSLIMARKKPGDLPTGLSLATRM
jgi:hypothetical protein